jgi:hypothetical protein
VGGAMAAARRLVFFRRSYQIKPMKKAFIKMMVVLLLAGGNAFAQKMHTL